MLVTNDPLGWKIAKWSATAGFVFATICVLSPITASTAITPWAIYLIANAVWMADSYRLQNWPWMFLSLFFCLWDVLLILSRIFGLTTFTYLQPLITFLERLP